VGSTSAATGDISEVAFFLQNVLFYDANGMMP
jgi:hypothetical protein